MQDRPLIETSGHGGHVRAPMMVFDDVGFSVSGRPLLAGVTLDVAVGGPLVLVGPNGAVMIVGGNIDGFTRVMTTAIALETSKGNLAMAIGLGSVLLILIMTINALAWGVRRWAERHAG